MHCWVLNSKIAFDWQKEADELGLLLMTEAGFDATEAWKAAARLPEDRCRLHAEDRQGLLVHYLYKASMKVRVPGRASHMLHQRVSDSAMSVLPTR